MRAVLPASGTAAACSNVRLSGFGSTTSWEAHTYSANAPSASPNTSSPGRSRVTSLPTASTRPAKSVPRIRSFGARSPNTSLARYGSPRMRCQSRALTAAAWTRTSTSW